MGGHSSYNSACSTCPRQASSLRTTSRSTVTRWRGSRRTLRRLERQAQGMVPWGSSGWRKTKRRGLRTSQSKGRSLLSKNRMTLSSSCRHESVVETRGRWAWRLVNRRKQGKQPQPSRRHSEMRRPSVPLGCCAPTYHFESFGEWVDLLHALRDLCVSEMGTILVDRVLFFSCFGVK